ncbi:hypothetical protein GIB67_008381 [Kingdonia uniflora]|uniref:peroxidase n=1 Tax=Kingdonia uniflora TaxID=39325 RepID=A0A7J7N5D5_9MAGN|nr:hypothetical protein GIB67_008381 [Kingdonia uniflora]
MGEFGCGFVLALTLCAYLSFVDGAITLPSSHLKRHFYRVNGTKGCPDVERYVTHQVELFWKKDSSITPKLLRLLYSDCFVTGCDASILLDGTKSEKTAPQNVGLGAFVLIDKIKIVVEDRCPGVVSCADILNLATRDAVHLAGAPSYPVLLGRRDGMGSNAGAVVLPSPSISWESSLAYFQSKGLDVLDMTTLLGAHTLGSTRCRYIRDRLYDFNGTKKPDPNMALSFVKKMMKKCPPKTKKGQSDPLVLLNPDTGAKNVFSNSYYSRVLSNKAVLNIDQQLLLGSDTNTITTEFFQGFEDFRKSWTLSMNRMGSIGVLTGTSGEIRRDCRFINTKLGPREATNKAISRGFHNEPQASIHLGKEDQSDISRGPRLSKRQDDELGLKSRIPACERLSEGTGTHNPRPARQITQALGQYVTQEHMDKHIKELIESQALSNKDDFTRLLEYIFKYGRMHEYIVDLEGNNNGSYKMQVEVVQVEDHNNMIEIHMYHNNMIEIHQINNSTRFKRRRLTKCCDLTAQDKEVQLLPESSNRRVGISFEDYDISHVKFPHHDALVIMLKMKKFVMHTVMINTDSGIKILFQSTIEQIGLADQVIPSDIDISGFNGSKEERVGKIILPITARHAIIDVVFYIINAKSNYFGIMGHNWIHNMKTIASTYYQELRFNHNNGIYEIKGSQKLSRAYENIVSAILDTSIRFIA